MPRPTKDPAAQLTYRANTRMTDTEGKQLESDAAAAGKTVSDHLRGLAVSAPPRRKKASPERASLILALGQLGFIRSDINQLLKDRWAYKFVKPERVDEIFKTIENLAAKIHNELGHDR